MVAAAKKLSSQPFYRHFSYRDAVKRLGHGSNYRGKPPTMAKMTHIPVALVEHFQTAYFDRFPEIPRWHRWVVEQLQTKGEITTPFGRVRRFFGRPNDDATIREAIAFAPQSMAADYTNRALLALHKASVRNELGIQVFLQKHDELGFRYSESIEDQCIAAAIKLMQQEIELVSPDGKPRRWLVPAEPQVGWNLGYASESNPDGLVKYKGTDTRIRQHNPFNVWNHIL